MINHSLNQSIWHFSYLKKHKSASQKVKTIKKNNKTPHIYAYSHMHIHTHTHTHRPTHSNPHISSLKRHDWVTRPETGKKLPLGDHMVPQRSPGQVGGSTPRRKVAEPAPSTGRHHHRWTRDKSHPEEMLKLKAEGIKNIYIYIKDIKFKNRGTKTVK